MQTGQVILPKCLWLVTGYLVLAAALGQAEDPYHWPLDLPRALTSSFGEYRPGRFHMGIDLRTGPIGKPVYAAEDGYVSRVICSPEGYGKAVYLKLDDGRTAVYAHLDEFAPPLSEYVRAEQHRRESYAVVLYPYAGRFRVARGGLIAKSGQTGIGVPHLHYEVRDANGAPVSPHGLGITWPDTTPPLFRKAVVIPATPESTVNGDLLPLVLEVRREPGGGFTTAPVRVTGEVAFGADVIDPANGGSTRLGIWTLETRTDEGPIFGIRHDRIAYGTGRDGVVAYHPFLINRGAFLLQWRWPGNRSEVFSASAMNGRLRMPKTPIDVYIDASDFHGNAATLKIPLVPGPTQPPDAPAAAGKGWGAIEIDTFGQWLLVTARFTAREAEAPVLYCEDPENEPQVMRRIDARTYRTTYDPEPGIREALIHVAHPRIRAEYRRIVVARRGDAARQVQFGGLHVSLAPDSPYGTLFLSVSETKASGAKGLNLLGTAYRLWHEQAPIDQAIGLSFPIPPGAEDPSRLRVYRRTPKRWVYEGGKQRGGRLEVSVRRLGLYAVMEDTTPPALRAIMPAEGAEVSTRRPAIRAQVVETGSGLAEYAVTCNGKWLLTEYDPERSVLEWEQDEDLPEGTSDIVFHISDRAQNKASRTRTLTVTVP